MSTATEKKILKQVEFYFSDSNLPKDKFMLAQVKQNEGGFVPIATLASFKRMKNITEDVAVVVAALKKSTFLVVSEDDKNVRREKALDENYDSTKQSIYAKGFPDDSTIDTVEAFFAKHVSEKERILCVRLRHTFGSERKFKGSVHIEFSTAEEAARIIKLDLTVEGQPEPLVMMMKSEHDAKRAATREEKKKKKPSTAGEAKEEEVEEKKEYKKDLLVHVSGFTVEDAVSRESLRGMMETGGAKVQFVDFSRGQVEGHVRLAEDTPVLATPATKKIVDEKFELEGKVPVIKVLEGDDEKAYWEMLWSKQKNFKGKKRRGRQGGQGGNKKKKHN